eukprot:366552-Chlamydomonas_euryale.AAC.6
MDGCAARCRPVNAHPSGGAVVWSWACQTTTPQCRWEVLRTLRPGGDKTEYRESLAIAASVLACLFLATSDSPLLCQDFCQQTDKPTTDAPECNEEAVVVAQPRQHRRVREIQACCRPAKRKVQHLHLRTAARQGKHTSSWICGRNSIPDQVCIRLAGGSRPSTPGHRPGLV